MSGHPPQVSLITTCKGRLRHLRRSLPLMVAQGPRSEVIVVDYDCPDGAAAWVRSIHREARLVEITGEPIFNAAKARNRGAAIARAPWLAFVDADVLLSPTFVEQLAALLRAGNFYRPGGRTPDLMGTVACARDDFVKIEGYDEATQGWGGEDVDLYDRLTVLLGRRRVYFPAGWVSAIEHDDAERLRFSGVVDKALSRRTNALYRMIKLDLIRLGGPGSVPLPLRERLHAHVHSAVLEAAAKGLTSASVDIDASQVPGVSLPARISVLRRLQYEMRWPADADLDAPSQGVEARQSGTLPTGEP